MNLEELYTSRINARNYAEQAAYDAQLKIKEKKVELAQKFLDQISFLNKYGFRWELFASCNNGHDCCMGKYEWRVLLINRTIATSPFESIIVKEVDGEVKGKWEPTSLGNGRHVAGQDKDGWFTPKQLIMAFS